MKPPRRAITAFARAISRHFSRHATAFLQVLVSRDATITAAVSAAVDRANARLSRVEQIQHFTILPDAWMPGTELLTPTMKLRRKAIAQRYEAEIQSMY